MSIVRLSDGGVRLDVGLHPGTAAERTVSIRSPVGAAYCEGTTYQNRKWGRYNTTKNRLLGLIYPNGYDFDHTWLFHSDSGHLLKFMVVVGSLERPNLIWRRTRHYDRTSTEVIYISGKEYPVNQVLSMKESALLNLMEPCELRRAIRLHEQKTA